MNAVIGVLRELRTSSSWSTRPRSPSVWNVSATREGVVGPVSMNSAGPVGLAVVAGVVAAGVVGGLVGGADVAVELRPASGLEALLFEPHAAARRAIAEPVRNRRRSMYLGSR